MRQRMSRADRAKQFMPFSALKGYEEAVRESEKRDEPEKILAEDAAEELDRKLRELKCGEHVCVIYYEGGAYRVQEGVLTEKDCLRGIINVAGREIALSGLYDAERTEDL